MSRGGRCQEFVFVQENGEEDNIIANALESVPPKSSLHPAHRRVIGQRLKLLIAGKRGIILHWWNLALGVCQERDTECVIVIRERVLE